ncbi:hypothetical protein UFOVP555_12 [uncultured Caudovirales phage]|uniref:DUF2833 domain-containing protein n=1 Tax=uncultured Caudovirales phage TaxID=2100421 RepID=A0A6J5MS49_9CAUD|nr:hypothetical protein UFOVP555_12 [uncultured Caudovirales phage]
MADKVEVRFLAPGDIEAVIAGLRQADYDEVLASSGDVERTVRESPACSNWTLTFLVDGEIACVMGLAPIDGLLGTRAAPWMLGTDVLDRHPGALMKTCPRYIAGMLSSYPHLLNFVDARNTRSIRWLKRLGFKILPAVPYGAAQLPFHLFEMKATHV